MTAQAHAAACPHDLECRMTKIAEAGPAAIDARLCELDHAWTAGRAAKATTGVAVLAGIILGLTVNPYWLLLPLVGGVVLAEYLVNRQSILGGMFRAMGLPSGADVEQEKLTLKALRGDFKHLPTVHQMVNDTDLSRMEGEGGIVYEPDEPRVGAQEVVREAIIIARTA